MIGLMQRLASYVSERKRQERRVSITYPYDLQPGDTIWFDGYSRTADRHITFRTLDECISFVEGNLA